LICSSIAWNSYKRSKKKFADERVFHAKNRQIINKDIDSIDVINIFFMGIPRHALLIQ